MAANQFVHELPRDFFKIKRAAFLRHLRMENHLQQQIAQFLGHFVIVARLNRVNQFINFLNRMAAQTSNASARDPTDSLSANAASP